MKDAHVSSQALLTSLHDLVTNYRFAVTDFQRPYSWEPEQAANFVEYLLPPPQNALRERVDICGSLLLYQQYADVAGSGPTQIIDGQHRLGTWLLALTAVQSLFEQNSQLRRSLEDESIRELYDECCRLLNSGGALSFRVKPAAFAEAVSPIDAVRRLAARKEAAESEERAWLAQRKADKKDIRLRDEYEAARRRKNAVAAECDASSLYGAYDEVRKTLAKHLDKPHRIYPVLMHLANPKARFHALRFRVELDSNWPLLNNLDLVRIFQSLNGKNQPLTEMDLLSSGQGALGTDKARQALNRFYSVFIKDLFPRLEEKSGTLFKCYCLALGATEGEGVDLGQEARALWDEFEKLEGAKRTQRAEKVWEWCAALESLRDDKTRVLEQLRQWSRNCIEAGGPGLVVKETMRHVGNPVAFRDALRRVSVVYNVMVFADTRLKVKKRNFVRDVGGSSMEQLVHRYCFDGDAPLTELGSFVRDAIINAGNFYESKAPRKNAYRWLRFTQLMTSDSRHQSEFRSLAEMELDHAYPKALLRLFDDDDTVGSGILHAIGNLRLQHHADNRSNGAKSLPSKSAIEPLAGLLEAERLETQELLAQTAAFNDKLDITSRSKLDSESELTEDEIGIMRDAVNARTLKIAQEVGAWVAKVLAQQEPSSES